MIGCIAIEKEQWEEEKVRWAQEQEGKERDRNEKEKAHVMALELEEARRKTSLAGVKPVKTELQLRVPKLPPFDEVKDNMDSYLSRFERYAEVQKLDKDMWNVHLSTLLKGKALDVYSRLSKESAFEYDTLKASLLKRFELTEEGFRQRFHGCKPERGETFIQFITRSRSYIERWFQLGKVDPTYEGVLDFLIRDQLLSVSQRELYLFLKSKAIVDSNELAVQADLFAESRGGSHMVVVKEVVGWKKFNSTTEDPQKTMKGNTFTCNYCSGRL